MPYCNRLLLTIVGVCLFATTLVAQESTLSFEDVMQFEQIESPVISDNGEWVAYGVWPDRGDGEARIMPVSGDTSYTIERGRHPKLTHNGNWAGVRQEIPIREQLADEENKDSPQTLVLLRTRDGETTEIDSVDSFSFSRDGEWALIHHSVSEKVEEKRKENKHIGRPVTLRNLTTGETHTISFVSSTALDRSSHYFVYAVTDSTGERNGIYYRNLNGDPAQEVELQDAENHLFSNLAWDRQGNRIAYTGAELVVADSSYTEDATLYMWQAGSAQYQTLVEPEDTDAGWRLRTNNTIEWSPGGEQLYFGLMPEEIVALEYPDDEEQTDSDIDPHDIERILQDVESDIWHWDDERIKPHEKRSWDRRKNHTYRSVYFVEDHEWIQLADRDLPHVTAVDNPHYALGHTNEPYLKEITWDGRYSDYYVVNLRNGERTKVAEKLRFDAELSPGGGYVVYYRDRNWHLYDVRDNTERNLTEGLETPFYEEDHDHPYPTPGYGTAGWVNGDQAVLIYDRYDLWQFSTEGETVLNLTQTGREEGIEYRLKKLDEEKKSFSPDEELLLEAYRTDTKSNGFYTVRVGRQGVLQRIEEQKKYTFLKRAASGSAILFTKERYHEYPNLWLASDLNFDNPVQLTDLHENLNEQYNWGSAELVEWQNMDGKTLEGVVIKPGDYDPDRRYPVLVYFYELYSHRLHDFDEPVTNHRPVLAQYVSDGYVVFLPDVKYDIGQPGYSATKSLVPGVQKLVEMGIADPDRVGLHGHSWSGYQTAHVITQTDLFAAAVAGAPVSNMTSAYNGIRWESGLARQFQYEQTQSRIGENLWEARDLYIENSPVFYADRISTPLMLQFGDDDGAVPWYQGIELYLSMRRLGKEAVFLQYHDEPHHLEKFANKLDYAIKMKEYFDHYLKDEPAPDWIDEGVPYRGE